MSVFSKAVHSVSKPLKKAVSVAAYHAAGYVGGGGVGAVAGAAVGLYKNTKTSKAAPLTAKTVGTAVAIGAGANIAAGAVASGAYALSGAGVGAAITTKIGAFGATGGLSGVLKNNLPKLLSTAGEFLKSGKGALLAAEAGKLNGGTSPSTVGGSADQNKRLGYKDQTGQAENFARRTGIDITGMLPKLLGFLGNKGELAPTDISVSAPGGSAGNMPPVLLAGLGILALFLLVKVKK